MVRNLVNKFFDTCDSMAVTVEFFNLHLYENYFTIGLAEETDQGCWYIEAKGEAYFFDIECESDLEDFKKSFDNLLKEFNNHYND
ncbi:hypothetical protein NVP1121O_098 [Vibrio phage 1.121.O._10N.286.46.C4]|nr:hypothetical protein NVP1121O_098 [Vibrio phage 1.121.O._10N.286.46.C4]